MVVVHVCQYTRDVEQTQEDTYSIHTASTLYTISEKSE